MEDLDLKEFLTNIGIWIFIVVVFGSLFTLVLINKFGVKEISINQKIEKKENLYVLVVSKEDKNLKEIKKTLKENNISYEVVQKDGERYFDDFLKKISLMEKDIITPTLIVIEKKQASAILVDIKNIDELNSFLEYNSGT